MLDHDGRGLAGVARELAFLDAQGGRPQGFAGAPADRNARLFVPALRRPRRTSAPAAHAEVTLTRATPPPAQRLLPRRRLPALPPPARVRGDRCPRPLPAKRELVYASGAAELLGGAAVLHPRTRRAGGWWLIATLVGIFPANVNMAINSRALPPHPGVAAVGPPAPPGPADRVGLEGGGPVGLT